MPDFKRGDLVWVHYHCPRHPSCADDYGLVFQVEGTTFGDARCTECGHVVRDEQLVIHPKISGPGHYIPSRFLRLIPPLSEEDQRDQSILINLLEAVCAK